MSPTIRPSSKMIRWNALRRPSGGWLAISESGCCLVEEPLRGIGSEDCTTPTLELRRMAAEQLGGVWSGARVVR